MNPTAGRGTRRNTGHDSGTTSQPHALEMPIKMTCFEIITDNLVMQCACLDPFLQHVQTAQCCLLAPILDNNGLMAKRRNAKELPTPEM